MIRPAGLGGRVAHVEVVPWAGVFATASTRQIADDQMRTAGGDLTVAPAGTQLAETA
jgi:hypothetical protein